MYEGRTYTQLIGFRPDATWNSLVRERIFNHELRLSSLPEAETFWVAGANLYRSDRDMDRFDSYDTFFLENPAASSANRDFSSRAHALFAEATFPVAPATKLTLGGRYTWERSATTPTGGQIRKIPALFVRPGTPNRFPTAMQRAGWR
ncbi:TonB-dependent receptor [Pseudomonas aeruginosa]|nr:TonB-dependent receptor [Pseudomonas aeruginosa]